ncbi:unnamed protein product [Polarella glacialis]|uniref:Uncharacterized protein n=1 Tax=Polarella glacialis TaxID=89957 RepID=A0A813KWV7_POLGL|nr:unnamed protein product [Polarella glacialis]
MEPPTKKAKLQESEELEQNAPAEKAPRIKETPSFHVDDTTMNVMPSSRGTTLIPLTDALLQYLLAGARANVGLKSGRYMFEVKVVEALSPLEDPNARMRVPQPKAQVRAARLDHAVQKGIVWAVLIP